MRQATKGLAAEYGPDQIRVNALLPLLSGTGLFESFVGVPYSPDNIKSFVSQVPLGRLTDPIDVANAACMFILLFNVILILIKQPKCS